MFKERYFRNLKNTLDTARTEGKAEGRQETNLEIAQKMKERGFSTADIFDSTRLSSDEIQ